MNDYLTVSELTQYISQKFERDPYLERVYLTGEISNSARNNPNNHQYFTLKDGGAQIPAVMFKTAYQKSKYTLREGEKVLVIGRVSLYKPQGKYQIVIEHMEPDGIGQLYRQYEETKERLTKEGIFDLPKKDIPMFPKRIALLTSSSGAVVHDIMRNVKQRFPIVQLVLYPTVVQGETSAQSIVQNIQKADATGNFDTIIVGRGGGSFEDLFSFNEEAVVRAIVAAKTPIISSVGHETDTTLSDFVADRRASTPTEAAVIATPVLLDEISRFERYSNTLTTSMHTVLTQKSEQLKRLQSSYVFKQPQRLYDEHIQRLDVAKRQLLLQLERSLSNQKQLVSILELRLSNQSPKDIISRENNRLLTQKKQLTRTMSQLLEKREKDVDHLIYNLDLLSPLKILSRGYSLTTKNDKIIKDIDDIAADDRVNVRVANGEFEAVVSHKLIKDGSKND